MKNLEEAEKLIEGLKHKYCRVKVCKGCRACFGYDPVRSPELAGTWGSRFYCGEPCRIKRKNERRKAGDKVRYRERKKNAGSKENKYAGMVIQGFLCGNHTWIFTARAEIENARYYAGDRL